MRISRIRLALAFASAIAAMTIITDAVADLAADVETVLNWGEKTYPQFLPKHETTKAVAPWYFRYYAKTNLYVGVNSANKGVYLLYGTTGAQPFYVDSVANLLQKSTPDNPPIINNPVTPTTNNLAQCDTTNAPQGVVYTQNGNTIKVTTNGQCVALPKTDICLPKSPLARGLSVLQQMEVETYELNGLSFVQPAMATYFEPQIKSYASIKSCIKNVPVEFTRLTFDIDGCFDVTERLKDFPSIDGLITISPPVTMQVQGNVSTETVSDCFATDASIVTDAVTKEVWDKKGGVFVKR
jgi:hypothetical protein